MKERTEQIYALSIEGKEKQRNKEKGFSEAFQKREVRSNLKNIL